MTELRCLGEWYTLDTLTFMDWDWYNPAEHTCRATMKVIEALTHDCQVVEVTYYAEGDYEDRWVDVTGRYRDIAYWRPVTASSIKR